MFCRKCGKQIPDDSEFCYKCGARVVSIDDNSKENTPSTPVEGITSQTVENPKISLDKPDTAEKQVGNSDTEVTSCRCYFCGEEVFSNQEKCSRCYAPNPEFDGIHFTIPAVESNSNTVSEISDNSNQPVSSGKTDITSRVSPAVTPKMPKNCPLCGKPVIRNRETCPYCGEGYDSPFQSIRLDQSRTKYPDIPKYSMRDVNKFLMPYRLFMSLVALALVIWGGYVRSESECGYYISKNNPCYFGDYKWGVYLQMLSFSLTGILIIIHIISGIRYRNKSMSVGFGVAGAIGSLIAMLVCFTNDGMNIRDYISQSFGLFFLILSVLIILTLVIALIVCFKQKAIDEEAYYRRESVWSKIAVAFKIVIPVAGIALSIGMFAGNHEFKYQSKYSGIIITDYVGDAAKVCVPEKYFGMEVVGIGESAFEGSDISSVSLYKTSNFRYTIGKRAFQNCSNLQSINISDSSANWGNVIIDELAFAECVNLESISLNGYTFKLENGSRLTPIRKSSSMFGSMTQSYELDMAQKAFEIKSDTFKNCPKLTVEDE